MKLSLLPILIGFLSGLALDLTLTRFLLDLVLFSTVLITVAAALLMAHHHQTPRKKLQSRSQSKVSKSRKKSSGTSKSRLSGQAR